MKQVQKRWSTFERDILTYNYGKVTYQKMELLLPGRTWSQIRNQARHIGLTKGSNLGRKYSTNKDFFAVPNTLNSYWAGFIAADGCVTNGKLTIGIAPKDQRHIERFVSDISYTGKIYYRDSVVTAAISCKQYIKHLKDNFNITERKSLTLQPPNINNETLVASYIIGLIDGDGSISFKREGNVCITIYGTRFILQWVKEYFDKWTKPTNYKKSEVRDVNDARNLSYYHVCSSRARELHKIFATINVPRLARKWDKII